MRRSSIVRRVGLALLAAVLAACGTVRPETSGSAEPAAASPPSPTASLPPAAASPSGSFELPAASPPPSAAASVAASGAGAAGGPYAGLEQSKTPEGYYVLGDAGAPVTLTFYSDFI